MAIVATAAETIHARRLHRLGRLAFGPSSKPRPWARWAPALRVAAIAALGWGLATLAILVPKVQAAEVLPDNQRRHLLIVLDVSPSMKLVDAGPDLKQSRTKRASDLMTSFFRRVPIEQYLISVVACYNGAKPVVVDTKDMEVVRNIFDDLPLNYAFKAGKTDLFSGLEEAFKIAQPWQPKSGLLVLLTDGDTVPTSGMPRPPDSIRDVLVVGVGDTRQGRFVDGHLSRQDAGTLRQIATRLKGTYHDGNIKHVPTDLLVRLALIPRKSPFEQLTLREYALIACGLGASTLALLPVLLHAFGTGWTPGVPAARPAASRVSARKPTLAGQRVSPAVRIR
jgi:Ca-activated chloride channel family protein